MDTLKPSVVTATDQTSVHLAMEEQVEIGARFASQGGVTFFSLADGKLLHQEQVGLPKSVTASSFSAGDLRKRVMAYGLANGRLVLFKDDYKVTFTQDPENPQKDIRSIVPGLVYPLGADALVLDDAGKALKRLAMASRPANMPPA